VKYARIDELRQQHPVAAMCRVLEVSESGYHAWRQRPPSARTQENLRLETEIKAAHQRTRETYGPQRLQSDLADHGIPASVYRIKRPRIALQAEAEVQGDDEFEPYAAAGAQSSGSAIRRGGARSRLGQRYHLRCHG